MSEDIEIPTVEQMMAQVASETFEETMDRLQPMADRLMVDLERRRQITRARWNMAHHFDVRWTFRGLLCGIALSPQYGMNGYVKLPKALFDTTPDYDSLPVNCHGGLTYGPDAGRWVGFDCAHAGDIWPWREVAPLLRARGDQRRIFHHRLMGYGGGCGILSPGGGMAKRYGTFWEREWTVKQLRGEVNHLAHQIKSVAQGVSLDDEPLTLAERVLALKG